MKKLLLLLLAASGLTYAADDAASIVGMRSLSSGDGHALLAHAADEPSQLEALKQFVHDKIDSEHEYAFGIAVGQKEPVRMNIQDHTLELSLDFKTRLHDGTVSLPRAKFELARAHGILKHKYDPRKFITCHGIKKHKCETGGFLAIASISSMSCIMSAVAAKMTDGDAWPTALAIAAGVATSSLVALAKRSSQAQVHFTHAGQVVEAAEVDAAQMLDLPDLEKVYSELRPFNAQYTLVDMILARKKAEAAALAQQATQAQSAEQNV